MSMLEEFLIDEMNKKSEMILGNNIFTNSLIDATIQDGGK